MFATERYDKILQMLEQNSSVAVSELSEIFNVSIETIRRDLCALEDQNKLRRVHGGAISADKMNSYCNLAARLDEHTEQKRQLSSIALKTLQEGDVIAVDSGSTAVEFIRLVKGRFGNLKIITYSLDIFKELQSSPTFETILIGGSYMQKEDCFYGELSIEAISRLHVNKAYICPTAISLQQGAYEHLTEIAAIQKAFMQSADSVIALADSSKFEKTAFYKVCDTARFDKIITDKFLDAKIAEQYKENGINLINTL